MWDLILINPMLNVLVVLYSALAHNFGVAIVVFTILTRFLLLPLTLKQLRSSKALSVLQPKIQEIQKQYAKSREKLAQELSRVYREAGVNPLGCFLPMLLQLPIWIALYQSIILALGSVDKLSPHLYSWSIVQNAVPLSPDFLWLDLSRPDSFFLLPLVVIASTWVQQKMMTMPTSDPKQQSMNKMMTWMMPMMFGVLTISFPSGLALYWVVSNLVGIVIQYYVTGWGGLLAPAGAKMTGGSKGGDKSLGRIEQIQEKGLENGKYRGKRKDS